MHTVSENSKTKYQSFRIDDILNNDFRSNNDLQAASQLEDDKTNKFDDQPINLSSIKYSKDDLNNITPPYSLQKYENLSESQIKNHVKSISSVSSSSPTLSVASSDSPSFNQLSPTSKSPFVDHLMKFHLADTTKTNLSSSNSLLCSDDNSYCNNSLSNPLFINQPYNPPMDDFCVKLNQNQFVDKDCLNKPFSSLNYDVDKSINANDVSLHNISDTLKKFHEEYQTQQLVNNSNALFNQFQSYCQQPQQQNDQPVFSPTNFSSSLNQPNSSFYMQQFYIRMKMMMQAKPRKGGQIRFNHHQTNELEALFNSKKYLIPSERKQIAKKLSLSERQVKTWFQNRRAKSRRSASCRF